MNIQSLILFLVAGVLLFSCTKEETVNHPEQVNGTATRITLTLKPERQQLNEKQGTAQTNRALPFPYETPTTGSMIGNKMFSPQDESLITNVHILVFDPSGQIVSNNYIGELNFSETANIVSETYCGENRNVWIVANADVNDTEETHLKDKLEKVENVNDLQTLLISTNENGLSRSDRLTMVGNTTVSIAPNMDPIPIQMHYLAGKVTVTVTDKTPADVEITITGWDVVNIPKRTYLKGRMNEDAVNGTVSADYLTTTEEYPFEVINTKSWAQSFFLFENRCGNRVDRPLPTNPSERYPGMKVGDNNQRGKAWYAPPGATYMLIYGTYSKSGQMNNVVYKIYLGENPVDNYDIKRGKHYQYNVNVNGLNDIHVDTNIDWGNSSFTVTPYGDLEKMDAHPDFRVLRIGATAAETNTPGYVTVEVLNNDNTPCNWLSVSPLNLYRYGIKQAGNPNQPFDDATGCFVRTKYVPTVADELEFSDATFGITRKLTQIPFHQLAVFTFQDVVVYADEFNGAGERTAKVRVTYYKDENGTPSVVGQQEFDVAQQDAIKISDDLYMERYEESVMTLQPGISIYLQDGNAAEMQWGYSSEVLYGNTDRYTDGAFLTANAVYKSVTRGDNLNVPTWSPVTSYTSYRDKYPRSGEKVTEPATGLQTEPVYYYPELTTRIDRTLFFDPIYNSSAARYCHEKNRDANGNGIIDADETVWYLPSLADLIYMRYNMPAGIHLTSIYWTSSEEDVNNSWTYNMGISASKPVAKTTPNWVRCVRGKGVASLPEPTLKSGQSDPTKIDFEYSNRNRYFGIQDRTGLSWTVTSSDPSWLKLDTNPSGAGAAGSYTGYGNGSYYACAASNINPTFRTATITLTRRDTPKSETIAVTQAGVPSATVNKTSIELDFLDEEPVSFSVDNKGSGFQWTVTSNQSWLKLVQHPLGGERVTFFSATSNESIYATAISRNPSTSSARTGILTLSRAGMENINITVMQKPTLPYTPPRVSAMDWAGSNIYWDPVNKRLAFDDTGVKTHENYQGVAFYWGSLVAMSPQYPYNSSTAVLFSPAAVQNPSSIPRAISSKNADASRHHVLEQHDPQNNIGDICRYMTKKGWAPGLGKKWRLPTCAEYQDRGIGTSPEDYSLYSYRNLDLYGRSEIPLGRMQLSLHTNLPANGWLFEVLSGANDGGWWVGFSGTYWTGTAIDAGWAVAYMFNGQLSQSGGIGYRDIKYPCGVRCVLE